MKSFLISVLISLALGAGAIVIVFLFIEGWGVAGTVVSNFVAFAGGGFIMGKTRPQSRFYAGIFIALPMLILFPGLRASGELLLSPSSINFKNFYALLPLLSVLFSYGGIYLGYKVRKKPRNVFPR